MKYGGYIKGFTLIEAMIVIAILAITIVIGTQTHISCNYLAKENNYSAAMRQLNQQEKVAENLPFDTLPPEILTVSGNGKIQISGKNVIPESVTLLTVKETPGSYDNPLDSTSFSIDKETGIITVKDDSYRGKKVMVKYSFLSPDYGETATVPPEEPYRIDVFNYPINTLYKIELVEGYKFTEISDKDYDFKAGTGQITLDKKYANRVVRITYTGETIKNICSGEFLDDNLKPASRATEIKLIKLQEYYEEGKNVEAGILMVKK